MTIEQMKERKKEWGYTYEQIAELSGVPLGTVQKVFGGVTVSPRYDTLRALEQVFQKKEPMYVKESALPYEAEVRREKKQGEYTVEDYRALPEDQRMELIDGMLYDMAAPTGIHQIVGGRIYTLVSNYILEQNGKCLPMYAPIDVQLDCDEKTIVQPDVLILCDVDKLSGNTILGAPDFIVEVLSPSTRKKDMFVKLEKYMTAGVREYWMVDVEKKKVVVYDFEHEDYPVLFGFDTEVPVGIFEGKCKVDFREIYEYLKSFSLVQCGEVNGSIQNKEERSIMTIEQMKERKKELGYTYEQIAELSGVPLGTVQKVFGGVTVSPRYDTLRALEQVFQKKEPMYVKESALPYEAEVRREKKQGEYTVEDYRALPEDQRMELIDGMLYDMAAPTGIHQLIGGEIYAVLREYIRKQNGKCLPLHAPIDVQLDCDEKTIVQPDVLILCDVGKLSGNTILGAPDFIVEVLSPSTRKKDMFVKLEKYMTAGVREYWMVDVEKKKVIVYDFEHEDYPVLFGFDTEVPVGIFEGKCRVDFREIYEYLKSFSLVE